MKLFERRLYAIFTCFSALIMSFSVSAEEAAEADILSINWYHDQEYFQPIIDVFTAETGIPVKVTSAYDGFDTDVVMVGDYKGLIEGMHYKYFDRYDDDFFEEMSEFVPAKWRDESHRWLGFAIRVRTALVNKHTVPESERPKTLMDLADPKWKGRMSVRWGSNVYNRSSMAYMIARYGEEKARAWAQGIADNMAGGEYLNDVQQALAISEGKIDIGFMNTYYLHYLKKWYPDDKEMMAKLDDNVEVVWLDGEHGVMGNVTGVAIHGAVKKGTENHRQAQALVRFLLSKKGQALMSENVGKYPVRSDVEPAPFLQSHGDLKMDDFDVNDLRYHYDTADKIIREVGWKTEWYK